MPTLDTLQLPRIDTSGYGGREAKKIASHLYQVEEQLRYVLGHLDEDNLSEGLKAKIESGGMSSEILQTLDAITLRVAGQDDAMAELRVSLTGITSTVQEQGGAISELQQTAESITSEVQANKQLSEEQAAAALEQARRYTDGQLESYPTSAQMSSLVEQTAERITSTVAAVYSTKEELTSTVEQTAGSILSTVSDGYTSKTELRQTLEGLTLAVENGETASTLRLLAGETELSSGEITLAGVVTFQDLAEENGRTVINGSNITTGEIDANLIKTGAIQNRAGTTIYDLNNGTIQMGATSGPHVTINSNAVRWWLNANDITGLFYSVYGVSYIGAVSKFVYLGWITGSPNTGLTHREPADSRQYYGVRIEEGGNAHFNVAQLECNGAYDNGEGQIAAKRIYANGAQVTSLGAQKMAVATKDYGSISLTAAGSAAPIALDNGSGVLDETGQCWLFLTDEFAATVSANAVPQWHITPTGGTAAPLTVRKEGLAAVVTGAPGTTFDWLCILPQKGCEALYCEPEADFAESLVKKDCIAEDELSAVERLAQALDGEVLATREENDFIEQTWPEQVERSIA